MQYKVKSSEVIKTGSGKRGPWTLYKLSLENSDVEPTGFAKVNTGEFVTVKEVQNGDYTNYNYEKVESSGAVAQQTVSSPAQVSGADPRVLKLLVVIAEQVGVSKDQIVEILEG